MKLWALTVAILLSFIALSEATAQAADTQSVPTLYLHAERDHSVWFDLYLHPEPAKPERVSAD